MKTIEEDVHAPTDLREDRLVHRRGTQDVTTCFRGKLTCPPLAVALSDLNMQNLSPTLMRTHVRKQQSQGQKGDREPEVWTPWR